MPNTSDDWPALPLQDWKDTYETLHRWTQIVGKVRLKQSPWVNHSWHVTLYVTPRGLSTSAIPHDKKTFEIEFDFIEHQLAIRTSDGQARNIPLRPRSVAAFYQEVMAALGDLSVPVAIYSRPNEIEDATPFPLDEQRASYDADAVNRFWRALIQVDRVFKLFRARFIGKCSPVHFFWGSFDLAVTRFSGRKAPRHPGGVPNLPDWVARRPIRMKSRAPASGLAVPASITRRFIATPIRNQTDSRRSRSGRLERFTIRRYRSSFCLTMRSGQRAIRTPS